VEKDSRQFFCAKYSLQLAESDERDEYHEHKQHQSKNCRPAASTEFGNTLMEGFTVIEANGGLFQNFETTATSNLGVGVRINEGSGARPAVIFASANSEK